jgi:hypothetical protein
MRQQGRSQEEREEVTERDKLIEEIDRQNPEKEDEIVERQRKDRKGKEGVQQLTNEASV